MSVEVKFEDNTIKFLNALEGEVNAWLEDAAGELESQTKRNTNVGKVGGGRTKAAWEHKVDEAKHEAVVGNPLQTAIWLEFGTGDYALEGDGRKGGWYIPIGEGEGQISQSVVDAYHFKVVHGKNGKKFAFTTGMKPQRPLHKAAEKVEKKVLNRLSGRLKKLGDSK